MRLLRRGWPAEGLGEAECYERCHGERDGLVRVLQPEVVRPAPPYWYWKRPRNPRITGEDLRRQLAARLDARRDAEAHGDQEVVQSGPVAESAPGEAGEWSEGGPYERYVGRWSRRAAPEFLESLGVPPGKRWLDVGCGTGALTEAVLELAAPREVVGVDPSEGYVEYARAHVRDGRARFLAGDAQELPFADGAFDAAVSALVLNFVPDPELAVAVSGNGGASFLPKHRAVVRDSDNRITDSIVKIPFLSGVVWSGNNVEAIGNGWVEAVDPFAVRKDIKANAISVAGGVIYVAGAKGLVMRYTKPIKH